MMWIVNPAAITLRRHPHTLKRRLTRTKGTSSAVAEDVRVSCLDYLRSLADGHEPFSAEGLEAIMENASENSAEARQVRRATRSLVRLSVVAKRDRNACNFGQPGVSNKQ